MANDGQPDVDIGPDYRTNKIHPLLPTQPWSKWLVEKLNASAVEYINRISTLPNEELRCPMFTAPNTASRCEGLQLLRYEPTQYYDWHSDQGHMCNGPIHLRTFSCVLYLNDDFEKGGTQFIRGAYKPKAGEVLWFPSNWVFRHTAQPVKSGVKYAIVTWYYVKLTA